ncbi:AAA family ATPase [Microbacterium sp. NPDC078428]|uniref:AAA family ATPase n=1 Tax=Microbacterium sp. NPDC078428 TaxID=3364190 RepID=UPI0037C548AF
MRIHRIEVEGFGPFRQRQIVDIDEYADDGIFLISGRTGAGKSSLLDAICFALYGGVPRYDGGEKRLRSDHCAPADATEVALEFTAGDARWRVERSPEYQRAKKNGTGMTTAAPQARLFRWEDGGWQGVAARPRDVGEALHEILPLTQGQFLQVILLAQNRFARFLLAGGGERQALLRSLFDSERFEQYEADLDERRRRSEARSSESVALLDRVLAEAERVSADLADDAEVDPEGGAVSGSAGVATDPASRIAALERTVDRARYRAETTDNAVDAAAAAREAAETVHTRAERAREKQERRGAARARLRGLEERGDSIDEARAELAAALRAEPVRTAATAADQARDAAIRADAAAEAALREATKARIGIDLDAGPAALWAVADERAGALPALREAAEAEHALPRRRDERDRLRDEDADRARDEAAAVRRAAELDARIAEIDALLPALGEAAALAAAARADLVDAGERLAACAEAEECEALRAQADARALARSAELDAANRELRTLREHRLRGNAADLAAQLVPGEPCAVCGATEHPQPAAAADDAVSDEQIDGAEQRLDAAMAALRDANQAAAALAENAARARGRAGGETADAIGARRAEALTRVEAAEDAARRRDALTAEKASALDERRRLRELTDAFSAERADRASRIAVLDASIREQERAVEAARGSAASAALRVAESESAVRHLRVLADARAEREARAALHGEALARLADALETAGFESADAAASALRSEQEREALAARVRGHEAALAAEKATLLELELEALPEEPVDTSETERARDDARAAWAAAVQAALAAEQLVTRLSQLLTDARAAHATLGALAEEHAVIVRLADTIAGRAPNTHRMKLETFVLAAELEQIVAAANVRLADMSDGRYRLRHSDALAARGAASGLSIEVFDAYTGLSRPAQSLSGGETFLASLALALGLAEVVTARAGGVRLDTLFIDEGFGSLDAETLETAMRTLDELRQGGRTVGLISHVEAMREQIPAQLRVEALPGGPSLVHQTVRLEV